MLEGVILSQVSHRHSIVTFVLSHYGQGVKFWTRCADDSLQLRVYVTTVVLFTMYVSWKVASHLNLRVEGSIQTALETYKIWLEVIIREHWVGQFWNEVPVRPLTVWNLQWRSHLHCTEFFVNGLICTLCETFLIRRCWKVRRHLPPFTNKRMTIRRAAPDDREELLDSMSSVGVDCRNPSCKHLSG